MVKKQNIKISEIALSSLCIFVGVYVLIASIVNFGLSFIGFASTWIIWYLIMALGTAAIGAVAIYIILWCVKNIWSEV